MAGKIGRPTKYLYELDGETVSLTQICNRFGLKYKAVLQRMNKGMDINDAVDYCMHDPNCWQGMKARDR